MRRRHSFVMYTDSKLCARRIVIVKMSSLGDILQSLSVIDDLLTRFPEATIDWIVEKRFADLLKAHPGISRVFSVDLSKGKKVRSIVSFLWTLRKESWDLLLDLQGNTKSALFTFFAKAKEKVGFGRSSVREWPNLWVTRHHCNPPAETNMHEKGKRVLEELFQSPAPLTKKRRLSLSSSEETAFLSLKKEMKDHSYAMVCMGSIWENKRLSFKMWEDFLAKVEKEEGFSFLFVSGNEKEQKEAQRMQEQFSKSLLLHLPSLPLWQQLMGEVEIVFALDSSALHLAATSAKKSFSFFGPTHPERFKPPGKEHGNFWGKCPLQVSFSKQCPFLRSCKTGGCMKDVLVEDLYQAFMAWRRAGKSTFSSTR